MKKWALVLAFWLLIFAVLGASGAGAEELESNAALRESHGKFSSEFNQLFSEWAKENKIAFASWQITSNFSRDRKGRPFFWIRLLLNGGARSFFILVSVPQGDDEISDVAEAALNTFKKLMAREVRKSVF